MKIFTALATVFSIALAAGAPASAQNQYPSRNVRIVMPFPAGSGTDALARILADQLTRKWNRSVVVDNMTGAGGNVGGQVVSRAEPDGHTLLFVPAPPLVINPFIYKNMGYDVTAMTPIIVIGAVPYVMIVRPNFPAKDLKGFIAYAKANPGKVTYASSSVGSTAHLAALQLEKRLGAQMVHVPYRGAAPALADVMNGHVDFVFDIVTTSKPLVEGKKVLSFGVAAPQRAKIMPTEPTMGENGLPEFFGGSWFAMVGPANLPPALAKKIYEDSAEILKRPDIDARLQGMGVEVSGAGLAEAGKFFAEERKLWGGIVKERIGGPIN